MNPDTPKKFDLVIQINEKKSPMIPFIQNVFGNILSATLKELENIGSEGLIQEIKCDITPELYPNNHVLLTVGDKSIEMKPFIQNMIWKTLTGFLSSLKKMPEDLHTAKIAISMKAK